MAAHVVEAAQRSVAAAHEQERFAQELRCEIVAGMRDLAGVTHHLPGAREDFFFFRGEHRRVRVQRSGEGPGLPDLRLDMKYILGKIHSLLTNLRRDILRAARTGVAPLHKLLNIR